MIKNKARYQKFTQSRCIKHKAAATAFFTVLILSIPAKSEENFYNFQMNAQNNSLSQNNLFFSSHPLRLRTYGTYNITRNTQREGFKTYFKGGGADITAKLSETITAGVGYGYLTADLKQAGETNRIDGDSYYLFGKYQPKKWYLSGRFLFNHEQYKDKSFKSDEADADIYQGELFSGYEMGNVHNYSGLKYTYLHGTDKEHTVNAVPPDNGEVLTAVVGTEYQRVFHPLESVILSPRFWLSANYDLKSNSQQTIVDIPNSQFVYAFSGRRLHRLGLETGLRLGAAYKQAEVSVGYGLNWRVSHTSQTGDIRLSWHF